MRETAYQRNVQTYTLMFGGRVVFEGAFKSVIRLTSTGTRFWNLPEKSRYARQLSNASKTQISTARTAQLHRDIEIYLRQLLDQKLIFVA